MSDSAESIEHAVTATVDADTLERYLSHIYAVVNEAKLEFTENGITCHAVDPANVSSVHSHLDALHLDNYDATDIEIGVNIHRLKTVLESFNGEVTLSINATGTEIGVSDGEAEYGMKYIDPDKIRDADENEEWESTTHVLVRANQLKRGVALASEAGDAIRIQYDSKPEALTVSNDDGVDTAALDIPAEDALENTSANGLYSEDYLNDILGAIKPSVLVNVKLGVEVPLGLQVATGGIESRFAIAPRIKGVGQ